MKKNFSVLQSMLEGFKRDSLGLFILMVVFFTMTLTMCKLYNKEHEERKKADEYIFYLETSLYPEQLELIKESEPFKTYYDF